MVSPTPTYKRAQWRESSLLLNGLALHIGCGEWGLACERCCTTGRRWRGRNLGKPKATSACRASHRLPPSGSMLMHLEPDQMFEVCSIDTDVVRLTREAGAIAPITVECPRLFFTTHCYLCPQRQQQRSGPRSTDTHIHSSGQACGGDVSGVPDSGVYFMVITWTVRWLSIVATLSSLDPPGGSGRITRVRGRCSHKTLFDRSQPQCNILSVLSHARNSPFFRAW